MTFILFENQFGLHKYLTLILSFVANDRGPSSPIVSENEESAVPSIHDLISGSIAADCAINLLRRGSLANHGGLW